MSYVIQKDKDNILYTVFQRRDALLKLSSVSSAVKEKSKNLILVVKITAQSRVFFLIKILLCLIISVNFEDEFLFIIFCTVNGKKYLCRRFIEFETWPKFTFQISKSEIIFKSFLYEMVYMHKTIF